MENKVRKLFPGGNTANGSYNFFEYMIPSNVNRIFCLKGGPGVGKSSLMKKIANEFIEKGYEVELHYCPSDPSSLDGVVIKKLGVVLLDGTAPHIVDPKDPGAIDEVVNLGDYWNLENMEKNRTGIVECGKDIGNSFKRAYKYLKAAEPIYYDMEEKYMDCMDFVAITTQLYPKCFIHSYIITSSLVGSCLISTSKKIAHSSSLSSRYLSIILPHFSFSDLAILAYP